MGGGGKLGAVGGREEPRLGAVISEPRCSLNVLRCSGVVVISVLRGRTSKARRETFVTTETSPGKPSRIPEGHLKLVPQPWWSLGACRPVLGGRLLVSGAGPRSSVRKGVRERSGCPGSCGLPQKCVRTCHCGVAKLCAPELHLVGARMHEAYATRLGSVHLLGDVRRTHVRRSRHLSFYDPEVEGRQVTRV
ncbi:hypothetical protein CRG98_008109 [Punica granatum]|uniref:Uncharacterized protein n=1 Tax=Punica granatum TaxID=22663 RepID=A0A2I0KSP0_PUNGR|nr:hypothetical protein CRG98_008109 [Punica granatum]